MEAGLWKRQRRRAKHPQPASTAGGVGRAGAVGQLGACVAGGPGCGRPGANLDP